MFGTYSSLSELDFYLHSTSINQFIFVSILNQLISIYNDQYERDQPFSFLFSFICNMVTTFRKNQILLMFNIIMMTINMSDHDIT